MEIERARLRLDRVPFRRPVAPPAHACLMREMQQEFPREGVVHAEDTIIPAKADGGASQCLSKPVLRLPLQSKVLLSGQHPVVFYRVAASAQWTVSPPAATQADRDNPEGQRAAQCLGCICCIEGTQAKPSPAWVCEDIAGLLVSTWASEVRR
jgi:hypothetical protein